MSNTKTLNLTPAFVVWSAVFVIIALATGNMGLLWVAALPWLFSLAFVACGFALIGLLYLSGKPITVTTARKGRRVVQRGR